MNSWKDVKSILSFNIVLNNINILVYLELSYLILNSAEDTTPFVNNEEFGAQEDFMSCNCMDENCPNSRAAPYDRVSVPYKRFHNEPDLHPSMDVVGASINSR